MKRSDIIDAIHAERARQDQKWGEQRHASEPWIAILTEEVGEVAQEVLNVFFEGTNTEKLKKELVQVAAVAVCWLETLE